MRNSGALAVLALAIGLTSLATPARASTLFGSNVSIVAGLALSVSGATTAVAGPGEEFRLVAGDGFALGVDIGSDRVVLRSLPVANPAPILNIFAELSGLVFTGPPAAILGFDVTIPANVTVLNRGNFAGAGDFGFFISPGSPPVEWPVGAEVVVTFLTDPRLPAVTVPVPGGWPLLAAALLGLGLVVPLRR